MIFTRIRKGIAAGALTCAATAIFLGAGVGAANATLTYGSCSTCPRTVLPTVAAAGMNRTPYEGANVWEHPSGYVAYDDRVGPGEIVRVTSFLERWNGSTWVYTGQYEETLVQAWGTLRPVAVVDAPGWPYSSSSMLGYNTSSNSIPIRSAGYYRLRVAHQWLNSNSIATSTVNTHSLGILAYTTGTTPTNWVLITSP